MDRWKRIEYVGDPDHEGMQLATAANRAAIAAGLPEIRPAADMHRGMLASAERFGHPLGWPCCSTSRKPAWDALEFLSPELRLPVRAPAAPRHGMPRFGSFAPDTVESASARIAYETSGAQHAA